MTKEEANKIPALQIEVDGVTEDWFYLLMVPKGKVSKQAGKKALARLETHSPEERAKALMKAEKMEHNLARYGVACAAWVK